jgi:putative ABC transport system permease protein
MKGILKLAFKLLVNDRAKFAALLVGITFASFLMVMMTSMFAGILHRSSSTVINIGAKIWVMDPAVNTTANGVYQSVTVIGLDDASLFGRPELIEGKIEDIYAENGFAVVKDAEFPKLENPTLGTEFEINDHKGVVVGIAKVTTSGLFGVPTLYTTYNRARQYIPSTRYTTSFIMIEPKDDAAVPSVKQQVKRLGYEALTKDEFMDRIANFYKYQTGVGTNLLIMTVISFIVGLSISGQTFYTFILENLDKFGALKAIGAKGNELVYMILFQATFTALAGYGLGIGLASFIVALAKLRLPSYAAKITFANLGIAFIMVVIIAGISSYIGVRKVLKIEPFDIFRG